MIKLLIWDISLQEADDGTCAYYGGHFNITVSEDDREENLMGCHFRGNDRSTTPQESIIETIREYIPFDIEGDEYDRMNDILQDHVYECKDHVYECKDLSILVDVDSKRFIYDMV